MVGAQARLIVVLVTQPDLEAVPFGEAAQRPIEDVCSSSPLVVLTAYQRRQI